MAFRFFLGYYERTYTQTRSNGIITNHTGVVTSTTPTWLMDFSFTTEEINVNDDSNMYDLGSQLTQIIGSKVFSDGGKVFNSALAYLYAPVILEGETAQFTLYYRAKPEDEFQPYVSTGNALEMGDYGILFNKLKTVTFDGISYKDAVDSTTPLHTDETFTLDCNNAAGYFNLATIDNHYIAQVEYNFNDLEGALNTDVFPILPKYFNSLDSYRKNPHELDVIADNPLYKVEGDVTTLSLWGMDTFTLVGILASELYTLKLDARCYETNKAPVQVHAMYYNSATSELMHETTLDITYATKDINKADYFDGSSIEWSSAVATLIPDDATIVMDTESKIDFIKDEGIYLKYSAVYYVYPSKYKAMKVLNVDGNRTSEQIELKLGTDTFSSIFPTFINHKIDSDDGNGGSTTKTIEIVLSSVLLDGAAVEKLDNLITFKQIYGTSLRTIEGMYSQYIDVKIVYHGLNIYKATNGSNPLFFSSDAVTANNWTADEEDYQLPDNDPIPVNTENLNSTLSDALKFSSSVDVSANELLFTRNIDCTLSLGGTDTSKTIALTSSNVDSFFTQGVVSTFSNFEEKNTNYLNKTVKEFFQQVPDHTLHVYGRMYPAKRVSTQSPGGWTDSVSLLFKLYQKNGYDLFPGVDTITKSAYLYQYYGREFRFKDWTDYFTEKFAITFISDSGVEIPYQNCVVNSVRKASTSSIVTNNTITYSTTEFDYGYEVRLAKNIEMSYITIPKQPFTITSNNFSQVYKDYTWPHQENTEVTLTLPKDLVEGTISGRITGGEFIMILPEKRKMESLFNDIPTSSGYFPTFPLDNKMVEGEGVVETVDGINLPYCYGLNLDGMMGSYCTAVGTGKSSETEYKLKDLLNNSHTKQVMGKASLRNKFVIGAVGAGGSGATGNPQITWLYSSGAGAGSGGFGCWYVNLEPIIASGISFDDIKLVVNGGIGAERITGLNNAGKNGSDMTLTIRANGVEYAKFTIPGGKGGSRNGGSGGNGGAEPTGWQPAGKNYYTQIYACAGIKGKDGETQWSYVSDKNGIERSKTNELSDTAKKDLYNTFYEVNNTFIGRYLDVARDGEYKLFPDTAHYTPGKSAFTTLRDHRITSKDDWTTRKNILKGEAALKSFHNNAYGCSIYEVFLGNFYYQRPIAVSKCGLGGTGAPSIIGYPTYWLLNGEDRRDRFPSGAKLTSSEETLYYSSPCYGSGGCGGAATYIAPFDNTSKNQSDGRPGGDAYWAIFC